MSTDIDTRDSEALQFFCERSEPIVLAFDKFHQYGKVGSTMKWGWLALVLSVALSVLPGKAGW